MCFQKDVFIEQSGTPKNQLYPTTSIQKHWKNFGIKTIREREINHNHKPCKVLKIKHFKQSYHLIKVKQSLNIFRKLSICPQRRHLSLAWMCLLSTEMEQARGRTQERSFFMRFFKNENIKKTFVWMGCTYVFIFLGSYGWLQKSNSRCCERVRKWLDKHLALCFWFLGRSVSIILLTFYKPVYVISLIFDFPQERLLKPISAAFGMNNEMRELAAVISRVSKCFFLFCGNLKLY